MVAALPVSARGVAGSLTMVTRTVGFVLWATVWMGVLQGFESAAIARGTVAADAMVAAYRVVTAVAALATLPFLALSSLRRGTWWDAGAARRDAA